MVRKGEYYRKTNETEISVTLNIDGSGQYEIKTGIPFFNHMLAQFVKHGDFDLNLRAQGDLDVDFHHTVEDVGITLGRVLREVIGDFKGIKRFGQAIIPMDDALSRVVIDVSGRPYLYTDMPFALPHVGLFPVELVEEFLRAFVLNAHLTLHVELLHGKNTHHQIESIFKALGISLKMALELTHPERIPSTKGVME